MSRNNPETRRLDVGYVSPERQYAIDDLSSYMAWVLGVPLYAAWVYFVCWQNPLGWIPGRQLVAAIAGVAGVYVLATALNRTLARRGSDGLGKYGASRLRAEFRRGKFRIARNGTWQVFEAQIPHAFAMREHRLRYAEGRAEERARMDGARQRPDHYRRAWEIILDYGSNRIVLAAIGDEEKARQIIRRLHRLDEFARGTSGAGTATAERTAGAVPSGARPSLD